MIASNWLIMSIASGASKSFTLRLRGDAVVEWGDGTRESFSAPGTHTHSHAYASSATYTLLIMPVSGYVEVLLNDTAPDKVLGFLSKLPVGMWLNCNNLSNVTQLPQDFYYDVKQIIPASGGLNFSGSGILRIPPYFLAGAKTLENVQTLFYATSVQEIGAGVFAGCTSLTNCFGTFAELPGITSIPGDLFEGCIALNNLSYCFFNDSNLTGPTPKIGGVELWDIPGMTGNACFVGCVGLSNYADIPTEWKTE